jgi:hypothetical protein
VVLVVLVVAGVVQVVYYQAHHLFASGTTYTITVGAGGTGAAASSGSIGTAEVKFSF